MIAVDVSVLAWAVNRYVPEHPRAASLLEGLANGDAPFAVPSSVVHEFLALVTHPHAVARALSLDDAWGFVRELLRSPAARLLAPGPRHAGAIEEVIGLLPPGAGTPPGFMTAAILREHGVRELLSADRGMRVFGFLEVRDPIRGEAWRPEAPPAKRYRRLGPRRLRTGRQT